MFIKKGRPFVDDLMNSKLIFDLTYRKTSQKQTVRY